MGPLVMRRGDDITVDLGSSSAGFADKHVATGKSVTVTNIVLTGTDVGNYSLSGMPTGLGEPVFDRLDADLAHALMGVPLHARRVAARNGDRIDAGEREVARVEQQRDFRHGALGP